MLAAGRRDGSSSRSASRTSTPEPDAPRASLGFPRRARITRGAELQRIAQEGKRIRTTFLEVRAIASPRAHLAGTGTRVGLIVPRYRHSAVARNRIKRRLRELSRTRLLPADVAADIVIRIRADAYRAPFAALAIDVDRALGQLLQWRSSVPEPAVELSQIPVDRSPVDT
ncbi:MAG TPA: ribonuclease P protein component [Gemmatimonadaceae bacterium]|nr:ribonuclease P protein component [Gemmatimonadaceae bacterium]